MTICADAQLLAATARVLAPRRAIEPVLEQLADGALDTSAVNELRSWLGGSDPRAAAALDRLRASDAAAPHPPVRWVRSWRTRPPERAELQASPDRKGRHP